MRAHPRQSPAAALKLLREIQSDMISRIHVSLISYDLYEVVFHRYLVKLTYVYEIQQ